MEAVAAALRPYCHTLHVPEKPSVIHSEAMWHLSTEVKGELKDPNTSSLQLATALHPTPAVCGTPMEKAREAIQHIEPFDREFFTGMLGWSDLNGDGEWIVTIVVLKYKKIHCVYMQELELLLSQNQKMS